MTGLERETPPAVNRGRGDGTEHDPCKITGSIRGTDGPRYGGALLPDPDAAVAFLEKWRPGGPWVLTAIEVDPPKGAAPKVPTRTLTTRAEVVEWVNRHSGGRWNIYFTYNVTRGPVSKKPTKDDMALAVALCFDIDPRAGEPLDAERARISRQVDDWEVDGRKLTFPRPSVTIDSGGGMQGFFILREPQPLDGADGPATALVEAHGRGIVEAFKGESDGKGADSVQNVDRIMRLPGTVNWPNEAKRKKGRVPRLARVLEADWGRSCGLEDFPLGAAKVSDMAAVGRLSRAALASELPKVDDLTALNISDRWRAVIVQGTDPDEPGKYASRSEALWAVLCHLVRAGCPDRQIAAVILDPDYKISGHVLDQPNPRRYAVRQIERAHEEAVEPWLRKLNDSFLIVGSPKCRVLEFVAMPTGRPNETRKVVVLQSLEDFRNRFMNRYVTIGRTKDRDGKEVDAEMPVGKWWLAHPMRRQFHSLTFEPLSGEVVGHDVDDPDSRQLNLWTGFAVKPKPGDWSKMRAHILNVLANGDQRSADYILRWMAWTVQNPDRPAEVALTFRGEMGTGKGLFGREMARLFGQHGLHTGGTELISGRFNKHFADCCLLFADEITWDGDKKAEARMKVYLTEDTIAIEGKGADVTSWPNRLHVIISSNSQWVVPAGAHERRYVVFDVSAAQRQNRDYFRPLYAELEGGGREAMLHDMLAMDLGDWHPRDNRPDTAAMADQKSRSLDPLLADLLDMLREGSPTFAQPDRRGTAAHPFISTKDMADHLTMQHRVKVTMNAVGGALARIGATQSRNDRPSGWVLPALSVARARWNADPDLPTQAWDDAVDWAACRGPGDEPTPF